jgi:hypothetical protein
MMKAIGIVTAMGALALSTAALAGTGGLADYGTPGTDTAYANSNGCSDHGTFGALGKSNNLGIEASPGNVDLQHATWLGSYPGPGTTSQTGINNSTLCGNPQGGPLP